MSRRLIFVVCVFSVLLAIPVQATIIVNSAQPITDRINVNLIAVADNGGANSTAGMLGNTTQQDSIFSAVDTIFAQAGVDVEFSFRAGTYNSTFARMGTPGSNNPRPTADLTTIRNQAAAAGGVLSSDANTVNVFLVTIPAGFSALEDNVSAGLAFVGGNGVTYFGGPSLLGFQNGLDVLASVLSHEIGHNLGLDHISEAQNLMGSGGQRLNATQIITVLNSPFTVPLPEPTDGDFNDDGLVDGADFMVWQRDGSPSGLGAPDLNLWRTTYGDPSVSVAAAPVPEPVMLLLGLVGLVGLVGIALIGRKGSCGFARLVSSSH